MKTDIYTLLGMIKDNKAPTKIKYLDKVYKFAREDYEDEEENQLLSLLFQAYCIDYILKTEVTILETTLNTKDMNITSFEIKDNQIVGTWKNGSPYHYTLSSPQMVLAEKMLEIINYLNKEK